MEELTAVQELVDAAGNAKVPGVAALNGGDLLHRDTQHIIEDCGCLSVSHRRRSLARESTAGTAASGG
jgi:hypothetical protein